MSDNIHLAELMADDESIARSAWTEPFFSTFLESKGEESIAEEEELDKDLESEFGGAGADLADSMMRFRKNA